MGSTNSVDRFSLLSCLALDRDHTSQFRETNPDAAHCSEEDVAHLFQLATIHHVILRALPGLHRAMASAGNPAAQMVETAMSAERERINHALPVLSEICKSLAEIGDVIVIKSLDHWPDLGNDLDLFTNARASDLIAVMQDRFQARLEKQSWGDRLANKWNFNVPGLPELVEIHVGRLGQTGEQIAITNSLVARARNVALANFAFRVPGVEEQIVLSTLQRMYRHFYVRLCDIANIAGLMDAEAIDYAYLKSLASSAGLWDGLATYLVIIGGYVQKFRGYAPPVPTFVSEDAPFSELEVEYRQKFLRIPLFPQAASLYAKEWGTLAAKGELQNALRLSLLPGLAMAALVAAKVSGSDKGIW